MYIHSSLNNDQVSSKRNSEMENMSLKFLFVQQSLKSDLISHSLLSKSHLQPLLWIHCIHVVFICYLPRKYSPSDCICCFFCPTASSMLRTQRTHLFLIYLPAEYIDHFVFSVTHKMCVCFHRHVLNAHWKFDDIKARIQKRKIESY